MDRFFVPTAIVVGRRAQPRSRPAVALPVRRAAALPGRALTAASTAPALRGWDEAPSEPGSPRAASVARAPRWRSPLTISFQAMRAVLLANATAASLGGLRLRSAISQGE